MADVTDATFEADVIERSRTVPVVVDLWAEWCGPCKTLGPMIESAVAARQGTVELAKVDVDANPGIAQMFQVQSIPAVFAIADQLSVMVNGTLLESGPTPQIRASKAVQDAYLGDGSEAY